MLRICQCGSKSDVRWENCPEIATYKVTSATKNGSRNKIAQISSAQKHCTILRLF